MSLLTKEQEETLEQSRQRHEQWRGDCDAHTAEVLALVDIVDDLQARAPKQYTEQEIMEMCRIDPSICADGATCDGAIWFACMTGALKAEP